MLQTERRELVRFIIILSITFLCYQTGVAQQTWNGVNLDFKASEKWKIESKNQYRLTNLWDEWDQVFTQISSKYSPIEQVGIRSFYRYSVRNDNANRHRVGGDLLLGTKLKKTDFSFSYRFRFQHTLREGEPDESKSVLRNKAGVVYKLDKLAKPYFSTEYFSALNEGESNSIRFTLGLQTRLSNMLRLASFYRFQKEEGEDAERVIGVLLTIKLAKEMFSESEPIDD